MSRVGPITDVAAQLIGGTTANLQANADRQMQALLAGAKMKSDAKMQQAAIDADLQINTARNKAMLEAESMQQAGFDKQRASAEQMQTQELEARRQMQEADQEAQRKLQEERHKFLEEEARRAKEEAQRERALMLKLEQAKMLGPGPNARQAIEDELNAVRQNRARIEDEMLAAQGVLRNMEAAGIMGMAQAGTAMAGIASGMEAADERNVSAVSKSMAAAATDLVADKRLNREFRAALSRGAAKGDGSDVMLVVDQVVKGLEREGVFNHVGDQAGAYAALREVIVLAAGRGQTLGVQNDLGVGAALEKKLGEAMGRLATTADPTTAYSVLQAVGRKFDAVATGAEQWDVGIAMQEAAGAEGGGLRSGERRRFTDIVRGLSTVDNVTERLSEQSGMKSGAMRADRVRALHQRMMSAYAVVDPTGYNKAMDELRHEADKGDKAAQGYLEILGQLGGTLERRAGAEQDVARLTREERAQGERQANAEDFAREATERQRREAMDRLIREEETLEE